jgi:hypothetical protein
MPTSITNIIDGSMMTMSRVDESYQLDCLSDNWQMPELEKQRTVLQPQTSW